MVLQQMRAALILCACAAISACASVNAGADFAPSAKFSSYRTYDWGGGDTLPLGDPRLDNNPFFDARVRAAVDLELAAKGLRRVSNAPDLLVHYHASVRQRVDVITSDEQRGYTSPTYGTSQQVVDFEEGTLVVDIAERNAKQILWRGWAQTDVTGLMNNPRDMEKRISRSVALMMKRFPRTP